MTDPPTDPQHDPAFQSERSRRMAEQADDAYRAIGRYIVWFSRLTSRMRWEMAGRLSRPGDPPHIAHMPMGELTAVPLANAFFGLCRELAELDTSELAIESWLRNRVIKEAQERNYIVHGDWTIGMGPIDAQDMNAPTAIRVKPDRTNGVWQVREIATDKIDAMTEEVGQLTNLVSEFGRICFGTHPLAMLSDRPLRVGDIFVQKVKKGPVTREGPRVCEFPGWFNFGSY